MPSPNPTSLTGSWSSVDGDHDAPFGGSVEFGEDHAGHIDSLGELGGLRHSVLAVIASMTSSVSVTVPTPFSATRRTFRSSSMRLVLVCSRPAVSAMTSSALRAQRSTAPNTTELGSAPSAPHDVDIAALRPHGELLGRRGANAAGRQHHGSPVGGLTAASFPIVVVLPTPLTPTKSQTAGPSSPPAAVTSIDSERSNPLSRSTSAFDEVGQLAVSSRPASATFSPLRRMVATRSPDVGGSAPPQTIEGRAGKVDRRGVDGRCGGDRFGAGIVDDEIVTAVTENEGRDADEDNCGDTMITANNMRSGSYR
ncbi:hypothetical protein AAFF_G00150120 [Aldrovandia affinis]|uniref:Uncharacterized protein n=1 Tax=Aldrovandia affinis TaxID=143900 RepID=A0AAD7R0M1_9TELE|nr:hypothetical protein AAFF_G00150120 [Aldrovandia affinis]